jgi:hypothetical protein
VRGFDFLIVLFSVLLGLSLSRLLVGLARVVVDPERRIHWLPLLWTIQLFAFQVTLWWLIYQRADQPTWTFVHYLVLMAYPVLLYFQGVLLYPELGPRDEGTLESFFSRRAWFFAILFLILHLDATENRLAGDWTFDLLRFVIALLVSGAVCGVAVWTRNLIYHGVLVTVMLLYLAVSVIQLLPAIGGGGVSG